MIEALLHACVDNLLAIERFVMRRPVGEVLVSEREPRKCVDWYTVAGVERRNRYS